MPPCRSPATAARPRGRRGPRSNPPPEQAVDLATDGGVADPEEGGEASRGHGRMTADGAQHSSTGPGLEATGTAGNGALPSCLE